MMIRKGPKPRLVADRFWEKVYKSDGCWEWIGSKSKGYGKLSMTGEGHVKTEIASRISWRLHVGDIPPGLSVLHRCDNPGCVRPDHLFLGTPRDNLADMTQKGRRATVDHRGIRNPNYGKHWGDTFKENQRQKLGKRFEITTPDGVRISGLGLQKFARDNNLNVGHLSMLRRGIVQTCKGFRDLVIVEVH